MFTQRVNSYTKQEKPIIKADNQLPSLSFWQPAGHTIGIVYHRIIWIDIPPERAIITKLVCET